MDRPKVHSFSNIKIIHEGEHDYEKIEKHFNIKKQDYTYRGPKNHVVDELIAVLEQLEIQDKKKQNQQHGRLIELINKISKKILFQFIIFNYQIKFDVSQLILTIIYWSVFIYMLVESIKSLKIINNQLIIYHLQYFYIHQDVKYFHILIIKQYGLFYLYSYLQYLHLFYQIIIKIIQIIINRITNRQVYHFVYYVQLYFLNQFLIKLLEEILKEIYYLLTQTLINCSFYVFSTVFIYFRIIKLFIITDIQINQSLLKIILEDIKVFLFIFLLFYQAILIKDQSRITFKQVFYDLVKYSPDKNISNNVCYYQTIHLFFRKIFVYLPNIQPYIVATGIIVLQSYIFDFLSFELQSPEREEKFVISYFFNLLIPPFLLFFGACFNNNQLFDNYVKIYFWQPLICNLLSIISINLKNLMSQQEIFSFISPVVGILQPLVVCLYLTIRIFKQDHRILKSLTTLILLSLIAFPVLILSSISQIQDDDELGLIQQQLFGAGIILILCYCIYYIVMVSYQYFTEIQVICKKTKWSETEIEINEKFRHAQLLLVSLNYILLFHILADLIQFQGPSSQLGIFIGLQIINSLIFVCNFKYFEDILSGKKNEIEQNSKMQIQQKLYQKRIKKFIIFTQILSIFLFLFFYFIIINQTVRTTMLILTFGIPSVLLYFQFLQNIKADDDDIPSQNYLYFILFEGLKYVLILQVVALHDSNISEEIQMRGQNIVLQFAILYIIAIAKVSIFFQIQQKEKKKIQVKEKKLFNKLSQKNIILSKKVLKRLNSILIKQIFSLEPIEQFFQDPEITLLYYEKMDKNFLLFLFISKMQDWQQEDNAYDQNGYNLLEKINATCFKQVNYQHCNSSILKQIRQQLSRINLKESDEQKVIQKLQKKENRRSNLSINIVNDSQTSFLTCKKFYEKNCHTWFDGYYYLNQEKFKNCKKINIYLNVNDSRHINFISQKIAIIYNDVYSEGKIRKSIQCNFSNFLSLTLRFYDYFTLAAIPLDYITLHDGTSEHFFSKYIDFSFFDDYQFRFTLALIITGFYSVLGLIAIKQIYSNTYGFDNQGEQVGFTSWKYWFCKLIFLINTQYIFVSKTFISSFFCNFIDKPYKVLNDPSLICMSDTHIHNILKAIMVLSIFFPLSTFLYPILQYKDKSSILRFQPTYVVYYGVAKLLIIEVQGVTSDKVGEESVCYMQAAILYILLYQCYFRWPCKFQCYNYIEFFILIQIQILFFGAGRALKNKNSSDGWQMVAILESTILPFLYGVVYCCRRKSERVSG